MEGPSIKSLTPNNEIHAAWSKLLYELTQLPNILSVNVFGSYITEEFKPWISDIDFLIVYKNETKEQILKLFEKYAYLDSKMRFHVHLFDPWIYSEKEIMTLPLKRMLTYTIPYIKNNYRTYFGTDIIQKIPDPSQKEIIESYLNSLNEMLSWLESHKHILNSPRLDLTTKCIILRTFNAIKGYLAIKDTIIINKRKAVEQFIKFVPEYSQFIREMHVTYENWTGKYQRKQVAKHYETSNRSSSLP